MLRWKPRSGQNSASSREQTKGRQRPFFFALRYGTITVHNKRRDHLVTNVPADTQRRHRAVYKAKGKASEHECGSCGKAAMDWSQIHDSDPDDVNSYAPLCRSCHLKYDSRFRTNRPGAKGKRTPEQVENVRRAALKRFQDPEEVAANKRRSQEWWDSHPEAKEAMKGNTRGSGVRDSAGRFA